MTPLKGMVTALQSVQKRQYEALTVGRGCGLSQTEMALQLETESGMRDLYDALKELVDAHAPFTHGMGFGFDGGNSAPFQPRQIRAAVLAKYALAKARGETVTENSPALFEDHEE